MQDLLNDLETSSKPISKVIKLIDYLFVSSCLGLILMVVIGIVEYIINDSDLEGEVPFLILFGIFFATTSYFLFKRSKVGWTITAFTSALLGSFVGKSIFFQETGQWKTPSHFVTGLMVYITISSLILLGLLFIRKTCQVFKISRFLMTLTLILCTLLILLVLSEY